MLSPDQFQLPLPARPDLVKVKSIIPHSPSPNSGQADSSHSPAPHKLELVQTVSGNSSPSREVANILEERQYQDQEVEEEEHSPADRTFQGVESSPSQKCEAVPLSCVPHPTEMDSVWLAIMRQIKEERDV
jgi:hypothetical protein